MKGKIKKLVEEACPLHFIVNGQLFVSINSISSLLSAIHDSDFHISVSIRYTNSWFHCYGMDNLVCIVNFEYDKE